MQQRGEKHFVEGVYLDFLVSFQAKICLLEALQFSETN